MSVCDVISDCALGKPMEGKLNLLLPKSTSKSFVVVVVVINVAVVLVVGSSALTY